MCFHRRTLKSWSLHFVNLCVYSFFGNHRCPYSLDSHLLFQHQFCLFYYFALHILAWRTETTRLTKQSYGSSQLFYEEANFYEFEWSHLKSLSNQWHQFKEWNFHLLIFFNNCVFLYASYHVWSLFVMCTDVGDKMYIEMMVVRV